MQNFYDFLKNIIIKIPRFDKILISFFLFLGIIYVGNTLSPSSYSIVLHHFQAKNDGLIFGRGQPDRFDETNTFTPLIQATVNNHFNRFNKTSVYNEDLRMCYSLPIFDWGIIFKPTMWVYFFTNPAYAFSFYHYSLIVAFLFGYALFFRYFSISRINSLLLSVILFFTGAVQYWWTLVGPVFAIFPWIIISTNSKLSPPIKIIAIYWISACWLFSVFYPPFFIPFLFIAILIIMGFKNCRENISCLLTAIIGAVGTTAFYLKDYLLLTQNTYYPGFRQIIGGGISFERWLSHFFPILQRDNHLILFRTGSILDNAIIGSFYLLFVVCFLNYRNVFLKEALENKKQIIILFIGLLIMSCWLFIPLPPICGKIFLWDRVPTDRMLIPYGFLLFTIIAISANQFGLKYYSRRLSLFSVSIIIIFYSYKLRNINFNISYFDFLLNLGIIIPIGLLILLTKTESIKINTHVLICGIFALWGMVFFGLFNPIQSSWVIFNRENTPVTRLLDQIAAKDPNHILAIPSFQFEGFPGTILNGFGYKSISHVLTVPHFEFWRKIFPDMPQDKFNFLFNRYAVINLTYDDNFSMPAPFHLGIPCKTFDPSLRVKRAIQINASKNLNYYSEGLIEKIIQHGEKTTITGWFPWININSLQKLNIISDCKINKAKLINTQRRDIAMAHNDIRYLYCGFILEIFWDTNNAHPTFDLVAEDKLFGKIRLLNNPFRNNYWLK